MQAKQKRIGIFGGSFDPPHLGHLIIAGLAQRALKLDLVFLVPAFQPPHKAGRHASTAENRLAMTRLSVRGNPRLRASDLEIRRKGISYTIDTVKAFRKRYPTAALFLIVGSDSLRQFHSWKDPEGILALADLAVYGRPGWRSVRERAGIHRIDGPRMSLSSSEVRKRLHAGKPIDTMVRKNVMAYIVRKGLYELVTAR
jgi:nicotinate-nucleotide adenylyltransferase